MNSRGNKKQLGFTIMELIAAFGLISVVSVFMLPKLGDMMNTFNKSTTKIQVLQDLRRAQANTVTQGCRGIVVISSSAKNYSFGCDYLPYDTSSSPSPDSTMFTKALPSSIQMASDSRIIFNSRGQVVDASGLLDSRTITLSIREGTNYTAFATGTLRPTGFYSYAG